MNLDELEEVLTAFEKPEFWCRIFCKDDNGMIVGLIDDVTYSGDDNKVAHFWDETSGQCYELDYEAQRKEMYDLTPIAKQWYEDESIKMPFWLFNKVSHNLYYMKNFDDDLTVDDWRLATRQERDSLYVEGK